MENKKRNLSPIEMYHLLRERKRPEQGEYLNCHFDDCDDDDDYDDDDSDCYCE